MTGLAINNFDVHLAGRPIVRSLSLQLQPGQLLGVIGPNGSGKSTLLRALAQLLPAAGEARFEQLDLRALSRAERARRLAYLAQNGSVAWPMPLRDFVALGRLPHARTPADADSGAAVQRALEAMDLLPLQRRAMDQLSGGELARARLARALAVEAPLLLADEPVAALDPYHQLNVMRLLRQQCAQGRTIVVVLHDLTLTSRFCDRVLLMSEGEGVACGEPRQVLTPANIQAVYRVQLIHGEHEEQPYVLPWH